MSERRRKDTYRHGTYDRLRVLLYEKRSGWNPDDTIRATKGLVEQVINVVKEWHTERQP